MVVGDRRPGAGRGTSRSRRRAWAAARTSLHSSGVRRAPRAGAAAPCWRRSRAAPSRRPRSPWRSDVRARAAQADGVEVGLLLGQALGRAPRRRRARSAARARRRAGPRAAISRASWTTIADPGRAVVGADEALRLDQRVVVRADHERGLASPARRRRRCAAAARPGSARSARRAVALRSRTASLRSCGDPAGRWPTATCVADQREGRVGVEAVDRRRASPPPARPAAPRRRSRSDTATAAGDQQHRSPSVISEADRGCAIAASLARRLRGDASRAASRRSAPARSTGRPAARRRRRPLRCDRRRATELRPRRALRRTGKVMIVPAGIGVAPTAHQRRRLRPRRPLPLPAVHRRSRPGLVAVAAPGPHARRPVRRLGPPARRATGLLGFRAPGARPRRRPAAGPGDPRDVPLDAPRADRRPGRRPARRAPRRLPLPPVIRLRARPRSSLLALAARRARQRRPRQRRPAHPGQLPAVRAAGRRRSSRPRSRTCSRTRDAAGYPMKVALVRHRARPRRLPAALQQAAGVRGPAHPRTSRSLNPHGDPVKDVHLLVVMPGGFGGNNLGDQVDEALRPIDDPDARRSLGRARARPRSRPSRGWPRSTATRSTTPPEADLELKRQSDAKTAAAAPSPARLRRARRSCSSPDFSSPGAGLHGKRRRAGSLTRIARLE